MTGFVLSGVELFASLGTAIVTAGGTDAPASGTQQTWTFASSTLPDPSSSTVPPSGFYMVDPAQPSELILVLNINGPTATVIRGADGTVPVAHVLPFTVLQMASGASLAHLSNLWRPSDNGLLDANMALDGLNATLGPLTAGALYLWKVVPRYSYLASNVWFCQPSVAAGASTGTFAGLYSLAGTLLTGSADCGALFVAGDIVEVPLTTPQQITAGVPYYVGLVVNLATTQPTLRCGAAGSTLTPNLNLTNPNSRGQTIDSGLTSLPSSFIPANVGQIPVCFVGIS